MKLIKITQFQSDSGNCWIAHLPDALPPGDSEEAPLRSPLRLFENGQELGPAHAAHTRVREAGRGAYSHWNQQVYLSTSDNSDPRFNRREYVVMAAITAAESGGTTARTDVDLRTLAFGIPSNYARQDTAPDKLRQDAEYALRVARAYATKLPGGRAFLTGKSVLEVGPGSSFATPIILKAWGAERVAVADRFLVRFQPDYHVPLYQAVATQLKAEDAAIDTSCFGRCVTALVHLPDIVESLECPIEDLGVDYSEPFDIVYSNAVLEHVFDPLRAAKSLFSVTATRGVGYHQVDFRDHRDFSRPLEYLLLDEFSFVGMFHARHGECGNRLRPSQLHAIFSEAGYSDIAFAANMWAEEAYIADLLPRLRSAHASPYSDIECAELGEIGGEFVLRKDA